jgi:CxxC motif-containing protein
MPDMKKVNLICIGCPLGCPLEVEMEGAEVLTVTGQTCKNGEKYARKELTNPTRIVTSTVRVTGGTLAMVSVKTASDIPKGKIFDCVRELQAIDLTAPVAIGDVIIENVCGTGVSIVATKNVPVR